MTNASICSYCGKSDHTARACPKRGNGPTQNTAATYIGRTSLATDTYLGTIKNGARIAKVIDGLVVVHPDDPPRMIRWDGTTEELKMTDDGAIALPPVFAPSEIVAHELSGMFEAFGGDPCRWLTHEQEVIEDLREAVKPSAVNVVSAERTAHLESLCRRALDVLEDMV